MKDLPYLACTVSVGINPHPIPLVFVSICIWQFEGLIIYLSTCRWISGLCIYKLCMFLSAFLSSIINLSCTHYPYGPLKASPFITLSIFTIHHFQLLYGLNLLSTASFWVSIPTILAPRDTIWPYSIVWPVISSVRPLYLPPIRHHTQGVRTSCRIASCSYRMPTCIIVPP